MVLVSRSLLSFWKRTSSSSKSVGRQQGRFLPTYHHLTAACLFPRKRPESWVARWAVMWVSQAARPGAAHILGRLTLSWTLSCDCRGVSTPAWWCPTPPSHDIKRHQTLPTVPWEAKWPPLENRWYRSSLNTGPCQAF